MKKCEVCGLVSEPKAETCPACGEASWCAIASNIEEPKVAVREFELFPSPVVVATNEDEVIDMSPEQARRSKRGGR